MVAVCVQALSKSSTCFRWLSLKTGSLGSQSIACRHLELSVHGWAAACAVRTLAHLASLHTSCSSDLGQGSRRLLAGQRAAHASWPVLHLPVALPQRAPQRLLCIPDSVS